MIDIKIDTVPHDHMRYDSAGDWFTEQGQAVIRVSDMDNSKYEFLICLHELLEMFLCHERGISEKSVDDFDFNWEGEGEPGEHPTCPYFREHQFASAIEKLMAHELGVDWQTYNQRLNEI